jgi:DDE superfamily endonuclease
MAHYPPEQEGGDQAGQLTPSVGPLLGLRRPAIENPGPGDRIQRNSQPGRPPRNEFEYARGGALQYLAAWDVHRAKVFGRCEPKTGIEPFGRLVAQVMTTRPDASARRVYWVTDNGSSHRGQTAARRLQGQWPTLRLIHLPVHASWLNQVYFSVLQRKVLTPNDFGRLAEAEAALLVFQDYYQQIAAPFRWKFTKPDLDLLLKRLAAHDPTAPQLAACPPINTSPKFRARGLRRYQDAAFHLGHPRSGRRRCGRRCRLVQ